MRDRAERTCIVHTTASHNCVGPAFTSNAGSLRASTPRRPTRVVLEWLHCSCWALHSK
jgi:hypothetical protein